MTPTEWAAAYPEAAAALAAISLPPVPDPAPNAGSETRVQSRIRLAAPRRGYKMFRNNRGAAKDIDPATGRVMSVTRYGLANDTDAMDKVIKSHDLIGWRSITITPDMVGQLMARFVSWEIKQPGWHYTGADRERAQMAWANMVTAAGGEARFLTDEGQI